MLREFKDNNGSHWRVWDVTSALHARPERARQSKANVPAGWLCFECNNERRRLSPIPSDWTECDEETLARMCVSAEVVTGPQGIPGSNQLPST